jgi:hypothetical protein
MRKVAKRSPGSTLIDKFEHFEMTTDLKHTTPREARLGRWVLLYGVLQVLSTLSVDVRGLKHTDGVRYFLCTDLKRCPEWATNGQTAYLEASQQRSWCWQRSWDPAPTQIAPAELDATPTSPDEARNVAYDSSNRQYQSPTNMFPAPPPLNLAATRNTSTSPPPLPLLDTETLMQKTPYMHMHALDDKITALALSPSSPTAHIAANQDYERRRRENEKAIHADLGDWKPRLDSLPSHAYHTTSPTSPNPSFNITAPLHSTPNHNFPHHHNHARTYTPVRETTHTDLDGYPFSPEESVWPVPPGYTESSGEQRGRRESGVGYSVNGSVYGDLRGDVREEDRERERAYDIRGDVRGVIGEGDRDRDRRERGERRSPRAVYERSGW